MNPQKQGHHNELLLQHQQQNHKWDNTLYTKTAMIKITQDMMVKQFIISKQNEKVAPTLHLPIIWK